MLEPTPPDEAHRAHRAPVLRHPVHHGWAHHGPPGAPPGEALDPGSGEAPPDRDDTAAPALGKVPDGELKEQIRSLAARLAAATYAWLAMIAEFDRRSAWSGTGITSCAHWLAWSCSMSPATAREHVRVARALTALPLVSDMFAAGALSYSKVRALTRIAAETDEPTLVRLALAESASQLERTVRGHRRATGAGLAQQRRRRARMYWDEHGMLVVSARLTAEEGAVLMAAVDTARAAADAPTSPDDRLREDREADRLDIDYRALSTADALVVVARTALDATPGDDSGADRHLVVLHVDADRLPPPTGTDGGDGARPEPASVVRRIENGPGVDRPTSERIGCDAMVAAVVQDTVTGSLSAGRRTRRIGAALRRALLVRDGGCRFPGCHRRTHLEAHHIVHWYHGGPTDPDNLVLLCRFHHMALHEAGFRLVVTDTTGARLTLQFSTPDGDPVVPVPPLDPGPTVGLDAHLRPELDPVGIGPRQFGERFSLADAVAVLTS